MSGREQVAALLGEPLAAPCPDDNGILISNGDGSCYCQECGTYFPGDSRGPGGSS